MANVVIGKSKFGQGLFATEPIPAGTIIGLATGPTIDFAATSHKCERECDALQIDSDRYLDWPDPLRLANHSCQPNCGLKNLEFTTLNNLAPGEEIVWDYSTSMDENSWTMVCHCGEPNCRGTIEDFRLLPPTLKQHYLALGIVLPFIAEQYQ
jgi:SET domain-containing protein